MLPYGRSRAEIAAMAVWMADPSLHLTLDIQDAASAGKNGGSGQPQEVGSLWRRKITSGPLPAFNDKTTRERALALLDQYDPDSEFILRKAGLDFMTRFSFGNRTFLAGNVQKYEGTLSDLKQRFESAGHRVQIRGDWFRVDGAGIGIFGGGYQKLMNAMDAEKYQAVLAALKR